jgi:FtsP/CotA-like multicopper oxidase with cupredoxin domain
MEPSEENDMKRKLRETTVLAAAALIAFAAGARAAHNPTMVGIIDGVSGTTATAPDGSTTRSFVLTAKSGQISTPDGNSVLVWGFAEGNGTVQYPGPTLIASEGETVQVDVVNAIGVPVSIIFPGQEGVAASEVSAPTAEGLLSLEAGPPAGGAPGGTVRYSFTAAHPGTYLYQSGTATELQVEMGLVGALIVRPADFMQHHAEMRTAYGHMDSQYDVEYLFLVTEMDLRVHRLVEQGKAAEVDTTDYFPVNWFFNGRCAPDTMMAAFADWLPTQPYNCMPMVHPGERMLMRVIGAGRDLHPFHFHGNHARVFARDGRLLSSNPADPTVGADLGHELFTIQTVPGQTVDAIWTWTGEGLGWDIYGHKSFPGQPDPPLEPNESPEDHLKPFPVLLPESLDLVFGGMWSGSPFLGAMGALPPGEGGMNPSAGFTYMWHSHTEKEMCNNDIFPGGMMTMAIVVPPWAPLMEMPMPMGVNPLSGGR